tara:strand:+ start:280 stop:531 length:252 start_codon:yes stop_codon:yes gene_type:complete
MKKVTLNIATDKTKKLIQNLSDLEHVDRQRMSSDGKYYLDEIWKLLGLPTFSELPSEEEELESLEKEIDNESMEFQRKDSEEE